MKSARERQAERDRAARLRLGLPDPATGRKPVAHGTEAGYRMERRRYGRSCPDCLAAAVRAVKRRRAANPERTRRVGREYMRRRRAGLRLSQ